MADHTSAFKNFVAGGCGGVCAIVVGHPFDTVKVRLQTQPKPPPGVPPLYSGMVDCGFKIVRNESSFALFKGMTAPVMLAAPMMATTFMGYSIGAKLVERNSGEKLSLGQTFVAGMISAFFRVPIQAPCDRIKVLLQVQGEGMSPKLYSGSLDAVRVLYRTGGFRSIYKGTAITLGREIPCLGSFYTTYSLMRQVLSTEGKEEDLKLLQLIFAGGTAGVVAWLVALPFDVVKSRLQGAPEGKYADGARSVLTDLLKREGPTALFKGGVSIMVRAFPANAALLISYEGVMKLMNWIFPNL